MIDDPHLQAARAGAHEETVGVQTLDHVDRVTFQSLGGDFQNLLKLMEALPRGRQGASGGSGEGHADQECCQCRGGAVP
ncbi:hypothetical protein ASF53_00590 [Methylobacterium sp. Leaf123]|nr:hypothetical protein ASF53_00590 [Methylobacterium sp. Leaf123]